MKSDLAQMAELTVVCGCMFAGKTRRLIELLQAHQQAGRRVAAFKHALDTRYDPCRLATHDQRRFRAEAVRDSAELTVRCEGWEVVGVDEAHFFGRSLTAACETICSRGQILLLAGLDHDAWGRPFPPVPELAARAGRVETLTTRCSRCGQPARYSQRLVPVTDPAMVGGPAEYEARCRACFTPLPAPAPHY